MEGAGSGEKQRNCRNSKTQNNLRAFLKVSEVADMFLVSESTVSRWISSGKMRRFRLDKIVRIRREDLAKFAENYCDLEKKNGGE